jgi:hypothetical protein
VCGSRNKGGRKARAPIGHYLTFTSLVSSHMNYSGTDDAQPHSTVHYSMLMKLSSEEQTNMTFANLGEISANVGFALAKSSI